MTSLKSMVKPPAKMAKLGSSELKSGSQARRAYA